MRLLKKIIICLALLVMGGQAKAQYLRIYHIGVGQGDCTLIVGADYLSGTTDGVTFSLLIDSGNKMNDNKLGEVFKFIKDTLDKYTNGYLTYLVVSHLHSDHLGNMPKLIQKISTEPNMVKNLQVIDRLAFQKIYGSPVDQCWDYGTSNVVNEYINAVNTYLPGKRILCASTASLLPLQNIGMWCLSANGVVNGNSFIPTSGPLSENDLSFSFVLAFNGFKYFTGGDVGGGAPYADGETPISNFITGVFPSPFHSCFLKSSHHGSGHSTNATFLNVFNPFAAVIPSALRSFNGTRIPVYSTINAFATAGTNLYYTYTVPGTSNYWTGPVEEYRDINIFIDQAPGFGQNIPIRMSYMNRDKTTLQPTSAVTDLTITCTKAHPAPSKAMHLLMEPFRKVSASLKVVSRRIPLFPVHHAENYVTEEKALQMEKVQDQ
jgi:hypothetical protein